MKFRAILTGLIDSTHRIQNYGPNNVQSVCQNLTASRSEVREMKMVRQVAPPLQYTTITENQKSQSNYIANKTYMNKYIKGLFSIIKLFKVQLII